MDGTGTQVATCMINKWTVKNNEKEIYNTRCPPRMRTEKKRGRERKKRRTVAVLTTSENFRS